MARPSKDFLPAPTPREVTTPIPSVRVPLPNGRFANLNEIIDQNYRPGEHKSIFADPSQFLISPRADCMYAWVAYGKSADNYLRGKVRSQAYRPVLLSEMREDRDLSIHTHKIAGLEFVACMDVVLVEVSPEAVYRLYNWREQSAIMKTVNNAAFQAFQNTISNMSGGLAQASFEVREVG